MPNPPLAGRPPYATDEDDSVYLGAPSPARRRPAKPVQNEEREMSQYAAYDDYFQDQRVSGHGGVGMGMMTGAMDDSDDEDNHRGPPRSKASPIKAPPAAARSERQMPSPQQQRPPPNFQGGPQGRPPMQQGPPGGGAPMYEQHPNTRQATRGPPTELRVQIPQPQPIYAPAPLPSPSPSMLTPHPLDHPTTPITPIFARPSMDASRENVKFQEPILRGGSEDRLVARGGPAKDDFWRRFSMVAKDEAGKAPREKKSTFLKDYEGGNKRKKRIVWVVAVILLLCIGGAVGLGWYFTHNKPSAQPKAIGGKSNETTHDTLPISAKPSTTTGKATFAPIDGATATSFSRTLGAAPTIAKRADTMGRYHRRNSHPLEW